jgi:hypothetical protein
MVRVDKQTKKYDYPGKILIYILYRPGALGSKNSSWRSNVRGSAMFMAASAIWCRRAASVGSAIQSSGQVAGRGRTSSSSAGLSCWCCRVLLAAAAGCCGLSAAAAAVGRRTLSAFSSLDLDHAWIANYFGENFYSLSENLQYFLRI